VLAKRYRKKGYVVACQDEATFGLIPCLARGWALKGSHPIAPMNYQYKSVNVFGARTKRAFVFSFGKKKTQKTFVKFLKALCKKWSRVCLFADNAPWHKGIIIDEFLASRRKTFKLFYFPKYCPELNPVEPCWKPARRKTANRLIRTLPAMQYHLRKTFKNPNTLPKMFKYLSD
jgi:transposase